MDSETSYLTSSEEEYLSSDGEHLYMAPSPRSNSTNSPGSSRPFRSRTSTSITTTRPHTSTSITTTRPHTSTSNTDAAGCKCMQTQSAVTESGILTLGINTELRRLFPMSPTSSFCVFVEEVVEGGVRGVEARALRDGSLVARGRVCAGGGAALRCLKGMLDGISGVREGEVVVALGEKCEGCGLRR